MSVHNYSFAKSFRTGVRAWHWHASPPLIRVHHTCVLRVCVSYFPSTYTSTHTLHLPEMRIIPVYKTCAGGTLHACSNPSSSVYNQQQSRNGGGGGSNHSSFSSPSESLPPSTIKVSPLFLVDRSLCCFLFFFSRGNLVRGCCVVDPGQTVHKHTHVCEATTTTTTACGGPESSLTSVRDLRPKEERPKKMGDGRHIS